MKLPCMTKLLVFEIVAQEIAFPRRCSFLTNSSSTSSHRTAFGGFLYTSTALPRRQAVRASSSRIEQHACSLQEPWDQRVACRNKFANPRLQAQIERPEQASDEHHAHLRAADRL